VLVLVRLVPVLVVVLVCLFGGTSDGHFFFLYSPLLTSNRLHLQLTKDDHNEHEHEEDCEMTLNRYDPNISRR
jgi:hypothetical protein